MAVVKPFRALRYDEAKAGPLETLVAPPYDVISPEQREELRARSPYNVVRLTLPDSEEEAAADLAEWRAQGILAAEPPAVWALEQDYVGPDGVARRRSGLVALAEGRAVRPRHRAAARADARRAEGGAPAPAPRDAHAARADLPPLRRRAARGRARPRAGPRRRGRAALAARRSRRSCAPSTTSSC